ncbi:MAG: hypothetical protein NW226_26335 [Microscillaceae bacterium]|nr:hypothetical protein [Microscillaceae bacterium]
MSEHQNSLQASQNIEQHTEDSEEQSLKFRLFKRLVIGLAVVLGSLAIAFYFAVYFYFNPYVKEQIIKNLHQHTDSLYHLQIEGLNINFLNSSIRIQKLKLKRNPKRWQQILDRREDENQVDIDLEVSQARAKGVHWVKFLRTRELDIDLIELQNPKIHFKNHIAQDTSRISRTTSEQISDFIGNFSEGLKIRSFTVSNAAISFKFNNRGKETFHQGDSIQLRFYDIQLEKKRAGPTNPYPVQLGDFAIALKNYDFISPNRKYRFSSDYFAASSLDSTFLLENLRIQPLFSISPEDPLRFDVLSKKIQLQKVDFQRIMFKQEFDLGYLNSEDLLLNIDQAEDAQPEAQAQTYEKLKVLETRTLKQRLNKLPFYVRMDTLSLKNSQIRYRLFHSKDTNQVITHHFLDSMNLSFEYLAVGRAIDEKIKDKPLYSKNVRFSFKSYDYQSPDGIYALHLGSTYISSLDSIIDIRGIHLKPRVNPAVFSSRTQFQNLLIDAKVSEIKAEKLDIERLAYRQEFALGHLHIQKPIFKAFLDKTKPKRPGQKYQNFEEILESIPLYILVNQLSIKDASVDYQEQIKLNQGENGMARHQAESIHLSVLSMQLGKAINRPALAEMDTKSLLISLKNYAFFTPEGRYKISLGALDVSSAKSYIRLDTFKIKPLLSEKEFSEKIQFSNSLLDIEIANILGQKIDFKKLLMYQEIDWGHLQLNQALINIYHDKRKPKKPRTDSTDFVPAFALNYQKPDSLFQILLRIPGDSSQKIYPPSAHIFDPFHESYPFHPNQPNDRPNRNLTDTVGLRNFLRQIPAYIKIDTLAVNHARLAYREHTLVEQGSGVAYHAVNDISFVVPQIRLGEASRDSSFQHFYSGNIFFQLKDYIYKDKYDIYAFSLTDVSSSLVDSTLMIRELAFQPLMSREEFIGQKKFRSTYIDARLKSIQTNSIDVDRLVFDQEFVLRSLFVQEPQIELYTDKHKESNPDKKSKTAEELLRSIPFYIRMDTFALQNATFRYSLLNPLPDGSKGTALHQADSVDIFAKNIELALDKSTERKKDSSRFLYSDDIEIQVKKYHFLTPDGLYRLSFDNLQSVLTDSILELKNLHYQPLWSREAFDSLSPYRKMRYDIQADQVNISTADFKRLLDNQGYQLHKIEFKQPRIDLYYNRIKDKDPQAAAQTPEEVLGKLPYYIEIDTLIFSKGSLKFTQKILHENREVLNQHSADSVDFSLFALKIDSTVNNSADKILFSKKMNLSLQNYHTQTLDELYQINLQQLQASSQNSTLKIQGFDFKPTTVNDSVFVVKNGGYQVDRFKTSAEEIELSGVDFKRLINHREVVIRKFTVNEAITDIYRDKTFPRDSNFVPRMPHLAFQRIPIPISIDTLRILHSEVKYSEKVRGGVGVGKVFFTELNGNMYQFNTVDQSDTVLIVVGAKLMGEGKLSAVMRLALHAPEFYCEYYGRLGQMEAKFFNSMIESNEHIRIKKGHIDKINYQAEIRDTLATGTLAAGYNKLKIQVLNQENHQKKRGLITFLANMIINNKNNLDRRKVKTGEVNYIRTREDGFLKLLWRALATGMVDTLK